MKHIFSGAKSPTELLAPPKTFYGDSQSNSKPRSRSSSFSRIFSSSGESSPKRALSPLVTSATPTSSLSPELVPIVTLLSAQAHRRYHEGVFLILKDLKSDGSPAERVWKEVYGVLIGTQLAVWDAGLLAANGNNPEALLKATAKPAYVNFTDSNFRPLDPNEAVVAEGKKKLDNTMVVSTTLKNRYFLQFSDRESFIQWHAAFRLSAFEFTALQEAYTGAFLSSRGAKLGDIRVILADSKFDYEDWVSVRFGAGMPWKRCYAVISQPTKKNSKDGKKKRYGTISFYESDKKTKKSSAMATVSGANAIYAIYPSSPVLIDTSTMIKLQGSIVFGKKDAPKDTDIFIMPEKHFAVPGYDTIIRFLVPAMNAFQLYGRPKRLIANRDDHESLLFGLPTLPHVHYLRVEDLMPLTNSASSTNWTVEDWRTQVKAILGKRLERGYTGCGSSAGLTGALSSPAIGSSDLFESSPNSPAFLPVSRFANDSKTEAATLAGSRPAGTANTPGPLASSSSVSLVITPEISVQQDFEREHPPVPELKKSIELNSIPPKPVVEASNVRSFSSPQRGPASAATPLSSPARQRRVPTSIEIEDSNYRKFDETTPPPPPVQPSGSLAVAQQPLNAARRSELSVLYDKYSHSPFGQNVSPGPPLSPAVSAEGVGDKRGSVGAYNDYTGSPKVKKLDISNLRDSNSTVRTDQSQGDGYASGGAHVGGSHTAVKQPWERSGQEVGERGYKHQDEDEDEDEEEIEVPTDEVLEDFYSLSHKISEMGFDEVNDERNDAIAPTSSLADDFNFDDSRGSAPAEPQNVFDPDFMEENQMLESESRYTAEENKFQYANDRLAGSANHLGERENTQPFYKTDQSTSSLYSPLDGAGGSSNSLPKTSGLGYAPQSMPKQRAVNSSSPTATQTVYTSGRIANPRNMSSEQVGRVPKSPGFANLNDQTVLPPSRAPQPQQFHSPQRPIPQQQHYRPPPQQQQQMHPRPHPQQPQSQPLYQRPPPQQLHYQRQASPQQLPPSPTMRNAPPQNMYGRASPQQGMYYGAPVQQPQMGPARQAHASVQHYQHYQQQQQQQQQQQARPMNLNGGGYPPAQPQKQNKHRPPMGGGFSQFMPSTSGNQSPYGNNPYGTNPYSG